MNNKVPSEEQRGIAASMQGADTLGASESTRKLSYNWSMLKCTYVKVVEVEEV